MVLIAVVALGIPLGACATGGPESASHEPATHSSSPSPTGPATPSAAPSEATATSPPADVTTVIIGDLSFGAPEITVAVGDVTFVNDDDEPHTVTEGENGAAAPNARFDVFIDAGESSEVTFAEPGDYRITCQFHGEMHLLVHAH